MDQKKFSEKTESEISAWRIAGRTAPFLALAGVVLCVLFAEDNISYYVAAVVLIWVVASVAWWWWALAKILKVVAMMLDTSVRFEEVKNELKTLKQEFKSGKDTTNK